MTTIVISSKQVAGDSMMSSMCSKKTAKFSKIFENDECVVAMAGSVGQCQRIVQWVLTGLDPEEAPIIPSDEEVMYEVVFVMRDSGEKYLIEGRYLDIIPIDDEYVALGSGAQVALGNIEGQKQMIKKHNLDADISLKQAIKAASKYDVYTDNRVKVVNV